MKKLYCVPIILALLMGGCRTALVHSTAPTKEQGPGINVTVDTGALGASASLNNVGTFTMMPRGWKGPIPPGWTSPTEPPKPKPVEPAPEPDG